MALGLALSFVCVAVFFISPPALAHTGSANPYWENLGGSNGATFSNPKFEVCNNGQAITQDRQQLSGVPVGQRYGVEVRLFGMAANGDYSTGHNKFGQWNVDDVGDTFPKPVTHGPACEGVSSGGSNLGPGPWANYELRYVRVDNGNVIAKGATVAPPQDAPEPTNFGMLATGLGGKLLSYDQVAALGFRAGWTTEQKLTEMVAITRAESSFRTHAVSYIGCCVGLMQIHLTAHGVTEEQMRDPVQNVAKGRDIYVASGWGPWEAYTGPDGSGSDGPWLQYEATARAAARRQIANGGAAFDSIADAPQSSMGYVKLGWSTTCANCTYELGRRIGSGSWSEIGTTSNLTFQDNNAAAGTTYEYRLRAVNNVAPSDYVFTTVTTGEPDPNSPVAGGGDPDELAGGDEDGTNSGDGTSCWSFNPITVIKCALRWAFVPGEGTESAWASFVDGLRTRPPFSVAFGAIGIVVQFVAQVTDLMGDHGSGPCLTLELPDDAQLGQPSACFGESFSDLAAGNPLWVGIMRAIAEVFLLVGTARIIWRVLKTAFSTSPVVEGGELEEPDVRGKDD